MNEHLANHLFRYVKQPAQCLLERNSRGITVCTTHQISHGRLGVSRCLLYTKDKRTKIPSKPCTI
jgi:hypothetical protein